jgi:hypothetical protein
MSHLEAQEVIALLFGAYAFGWMVGATFLYFKQFVEKI